MSGHSALQSQIFSAHSKYVSFCVNRPSRAASWNSPPFEIELRSVYPACHGWICHVIPPLQARVSQRFTCMLNTARAREVQVGLFFTSGKPVSEAVMAARPQNIWSSFPYTYQHKPNPKVTRKGNWGDTSH